MLKSGVGSRSLVGFDSCTQPTSAACVSMHISSVCCSDFPLGSSSALLSRHLLCAPMRVDPNHCAMCDRWGLWAPGAIGLVVGALILFTITDDPESAGFEPVESAPVKKGVFHFSRRLRIHCWFHIRRPLETLFYVAFVPQAAATG